MDIELNERSRIPDMLKIAGMAVAVIILLLLLVRCFFRLPVRDYYKSSRKVFEIPDIGNGYIAQGISYDDSSDMFFLTGYMKDSSASPIYIVSREDGALKKSLHLNDSAGNPLVIHAGGLTAHGDYIYVAGNLGDDLYVFDKNEALNAEDGAGINCLGTYNVRLSDNDYVEIAFTTVSDGKLYIGEFFRQENYPTLQSHHLTTPGGDENTALMVGIPFSTDEGSLFGLSDKPVEAYSIPSLAQGACFKDNKIYLSTSYALSFSNVYVYNDMKKTGQTINVLDTEVPLYFLDSSTLFKTLKLPPMSEEIEIVGDEMFTQCESASDKYIFGKITGGKYIYATKITTEDQ